MTPTNHKDAIEALAAKQLRSLLVLLLMFTGGTGIAWVKADGINVTLSDVAMNAARNTIILAEMRDDVSKLVERQGLTDERYIKLSERVLILEGLQRQLKEQMGREDNGK